MRTAKQILRKVNTELNILQRAVEHMAHLTNQDKKLSKDDKRYYDIIEQERDDLRALRDWIIK